MKRNILIQILSALGQRITTHLQDGTLEPVLNRAFNENGWFIPENSRLALESIVKYQLDEAALENWAARYPEIKGEPKTIGLVLAGNLPLVGWHDMLCVLMSGHKAQIKLSAKDTILPKYIIQQLTELDSSLGENLQVNERLKDFDAVVATGSGNTARYFEYYFGKYPNIIRRNRNSLAVLTGDESPEELFELGRDIFTYFGLGCRNVSRLFVPEGYDFNRFFEAIEPYQPIINHHKYNNNYEYNKSLLLLNRDIHLDNGFLMLQEKAPLASPMSMLYYSTYTSLPEVEKTLQEKLEGIQCIVSGGSIQGSIPFGTTQQPGLADYADKVDTMAFLTSL